MTTELLERPQTRDRVVADEVCHVGKSMEETWCGGPMDCHHVTDSTTVCPGCGRPICKTCLKMAPSAHPGL